MKISNGIWRQTVFLTVFLSATYVFGSQELPVAPVEDVIPKVMLKEVKKEEVVMDTMNTGINEQDRLKSVSILNKILADEFVLLVQTLNFHWNLVGPQFHDYHLLFDGQYKAIFEYIDAIAERVRALDGVALGSLADFLKHTNLAESLSVPAPQEMITVLLKQHEALIRTMRVGINETAQSNADMGTSNFLTDLVEKHEKTAWMLRSLLGR